jgi:hypothetical protein
VETDASSGREEHQQMERLVIPVPAMVADALRTLARREDRDPHRQAERLIREGLIREGALPESKTAPAGPASAVPA